jgi:hypothetical protein
MTEIRVSGRSDLGMEEAGNGRTDAPINVAMEMATVATPIAEETVGTTIFQLMYRNVNGKRRRRSEAPAAHSDWRSRIERTIRQQSQELMQLLRTVAHLANLVEARAAHEEAQRLTIMKWIQEREQKWDARHEDDKLWGAGIMNMIAKTMKVVAQCQEGSDREREMTARTDGGGLEAFPHADTMREEGPEEHQQPQQQPQPKPKLQLKLQRKPQPAPKPNSAPARTRWWETVPPRGKSQRAPVGPGPGPGPGPAPTARSSILVRRLIL